MGKMNLLCDHELGYIHKRDQWTVHFYELDAKVGRYVDPQEVIIRKKADRVGNIQFLVQSTTTSSRQFKWIFE